MSLEHSPARSQGAHTIAERLPAADTVERAAYSIAEFCQAHRISRSKFYQLRADGTGPRLMLVDTRVLITVEAAADWRREREEATAA